MDAKLKLKPMNKPLLVLISLVSSLELQNEWMNSKFDNFYPQEQNDRQLSCFTALYILRLFHKRDAKSTTLLTYVDNR